MPYACAWFQACNGSFAYRCVAFRGVRLLSSAPVRVRRVTRDRQAQSHKRKQGLLELPPGERRHLQSGLNILRPSTSTNRCEGGRSIETQIDFALRVSSRMLEYFTKRLLVVWVKVRYATRWWFHWGGFLNELVIGIY